MAAQKELSGAGLRGQVAGKTALSTVGKSYQSWRINVFLKKSRIYCSMVIYLRKASLRIIKLSSKACAAYHKH